MEIWKKIDNFEYYEISNLGNIRSLDRKIKAKLGSNKIMKGKNITPILDKDGYHVIRLYSDKMYNRFIHRLVAITFLPNPENLPQVNHKNGIKTDNKLENLEWCNNSQNQLHAVKLGLRKPNNKQRLNKRGANNPKAKLNFKIAEEIRNDKKFFTIKEISKKYKVSEATINRIIYNKTYIKDDKAYLDPLLTNEIEN